MEGGGNNRVFALNDFRAVVLDRREDVAVPKLEPKQVLGIGLILMLLGAAVGIENASASGELSVPGILLGVGIVVTMIGVAQLIGDHRRR